MKYHKKISWLLLISGIGWVVIGVIGFASLLGICGTDIPMLCDDIPDVAIEPFFYGIPSIFIALLVLFFTHQEVFQTWKKFALVYLPLAFIWILMTPANAGFLQANREIVTLWTSGGFLVFSLLLIAWKSWRLRRDKKR